MFYIILDKYCFFNTRNVFFFVIFIKLSSHVSMVSLNSYKTNYFYFYTTNCVLLIKFNYLTVTLKTNRVFHQIVSTAFVLI